MGPDRTRQSPNIMDTETQKEFARLQLVIESLAARVTELEARQNPDIRIQEFKPEKAAERTVWISSRGVFVMIGGEWKPKPNAEKF